MHEILADLNTVIASLERDGFFAEASTLEDEAFLRVAKEVEITEEEELREKSNANHPGEPKRK